MVLCLKASCPIVRCPRLWQLTGVEQTPGRPGGGIGKGPGGMFTGGANSCLCACSLLCAHYCALHNCRDRFYQEEAW